VMGPPGISPHDIRELYEAQAERARASQRRADATSICAIFTSLLAILFSLESPVAPSAVLLAAMLLDCVFLFVETAGLVDSGFVSLHASMVALRKAALAQPHGEPSKNVPGTLISLLVAPRGRSDYVFLLRWRICRVYVWLYSLAAATWIVRLDSPSIGGFWHPSSILARAAVGPVAGFITLGGVSVLLATVLAVAIFGRSSLDLGQRF
jgi:uncharacterized membrane protein